MLKNLIILPDGTEIFSGNSRESAIISCKYTQCVNDSTELSAGSCCSNEVEVKLFSADGLSVAAGDKIQYYKVADNGTRTKIGVFNCEKPTVTGTGTYKLIAYDNVSKLDKDLTDWLAALNGWPYSVNAFAIMVCEACGLSLAERTYSFAITNGNLVLTYSGAVPSYSINDSGELVLAYMGTEPDVSINSDGYLIDADGDISGVINLDYQIRQFSGSGVTGRMLMKWLGQITCSFIRANKDGNIEFAWYTESGKRITTNGDLRYLGGGLSYEDYQVAEIEKVQIQVTDSDVGTGYPSTSGDGANTYKITGNYLLTAETGDELEPVAQAIYERLQGVTYTPCKVSIQAQTEINAGDIVRVTDRNGVTVTMYVMTKTTSGQKDTLECTGSYSRDSSTAANEVTLKELNGKVLEISKSVDGLRIKNTATDGRIAQIELDIDTLRSTISGASGDYSELVQTVNGLKATISDVDGRVTTISQTIDGLTITDSGGTTKISGSMVETESLHVKAANIDGALTFGDGSYYIDPSAESSYLKLPGLEITSAGASFEGKVTATSGEIGGCEIENGVLKVDGANISGVLSLGDGTYFIDTAASKGYYLYLPGLSINASKAVFDGEVKAASGNIGTWKIGGSYSGCLYHDGATITGEQGTVVLDPSNGVILYDSTGSIYGSISWEKLVALGG